MKHLGSFATAVEAAVAYATAIPAGERAETARIRVKQRRELQQRKELQQEVGHFFNTGAATEAEGLQLHMLATSSSGYAGVCKDGINFRAKLEGKYLGRFATALEAAVAYAIASAAGRSAEDDSD